MHAAVPRVVLTAAHCVIEELEGSKDPSVHVRQVTRCNQVGPKQGDLQGASVHWLLKSALGLHCNPGNVIAMHNDFWHVVIMLLTKNDHKILNGVS